MIVRSPNTFEHLVLYASREGKIVWSIFFFLVNKFLVRVWAGPVRRVEVLALNCNWFHPRSHKDCRLGEKPAEKGYVVCGRQILFSRLRRHWGREVAYWGDSLLTKVCVRWCPVEKDPEKWLSLRVAELQIPGKGPRRRSRKRQVNIGSSQGRSSIGQFPVNWCFKF